MAGVVSLHRALWLHDKSPTLKQLPCMDTSVAVLEHEHWLIIAALSGAVASATNDYACVHCSPVRHVA
jgi:hypothetical protein